MEAIKLEGVVAVLRMSNLDWVETPKVLDGPHLFPIVQGQTEAFWHSGSRCSLRQWNYGCFDGGGDGSGLEAVSQKGMVTTINSVHIFKILPSKRNACQCLATESPERVMLRTMKGAFSWQNFDCYKVNLKS